jgi:hypothetical protein
VRSRLVNGALVAAQKDATGFRSLQDQAFFLALDSVIAQELRGLKSQGFRYFFHITLRELGGGNAAAIRALRTISLLFDFLRDGAEPALNEAVTLQVMPELLVFSALLLAQAADLDEIGEHTFRIAAAVEARIAAGAET